MLAPFSAQAASEYSVEHRVDFKQRQSQYLTIRAVFPANGEETELFIPAWAPGSYLIRDFAAQVENLEVSGSSGRALQARKTSKNRWLIDTTGETHFAVTYDVWAGMLNVSTSWVEPAVALLNGSSIFMYTSSSRQLPQWLRLDLPEDWRNVHTTLDPGDRPNSFVAKNFDELVDSPILAGNTQSHDFSVDEQEYSLVLATPNPFWDGDKSKDDVAKIVATQQAFWQENPFNKKYLFMNLFMGPFGGLEHDNSTVLMIDPLAMRDREQYIRWLGLVSHEFFHAWNVRRMRPAGLATYDYDREMYTRELWLAEGLSSYYDNLLLLRAGLISVAEYLDLLAAEIRNYETTPGREVRSAEMASFDTWIKQYKQDENSVNSTVSYYRKGALIGFVTDMAIRRETKGDASLDTVMRRLYQRYSSPERGGYPPGAFEDTVEETAGPGVRAMVDNMLRTTGDPDVDQALAWYGLQLIRTAGNNTEAGSEADGPAGLGVVWDDEGSQLLVEQVVRGHAGSSAGLLPGDELIAIADQRVTPLNYNDMLNRLRPGEQVSLTVARHGRLMTLQTEVQTAIPDKYRIIPNPKIRNREKKRLEEWLGLELLITKG